MADAHDTGMAVREALLGLINATQARTTASMPPVLADMLLWAQLQPWLILVPVLFFAISYFMFAAASKRDPVVPGSRLQEHELKGIAAGLALGSLVCCTPFLLWLFFATITAVESIMTPYSFLISRAGG